MAESTPTPVLVPFYGLARHFPNLPPRWLRGQARDGRLPHVMVGKRMFFHVEAVKAALVRMAAGRPEGVARASC